MELDDLKEKWKASSVPSTIDIREALGKKVSVLRRSGRGIRRVFYMELVIAVLTYMLVFWVFIQFGERMMSYMYKIMVVTTVGSMPVIWRLYKSQQWINSMDYGQDIRSNIIAFLSYYKTTLRIYQWTCYVVVGVLIIMMFYDHDFMALSMRMRLIIIGYMLVVSILATPYIRFVYGRRSAALEDFLRD